MTVRKGFQSTKVLERILSVLSVRESKTRRAILSNRLLWALYVEECRFEQVAIISPPKASVFTASRAHFRNSAFY